MTKTEFRKEHPNGPEAIWLTKPDGSIESGPYIFCDSVCLRRLLEKRRKADQGVQRGNLAYDKLAKRPRCDHCKELLWGR